MRQRFNDRPRGGHIDKQKTDLRYLTGEVCPYDGALTGDISKAHDGGMHALSRCNVKYALHLYGNDCVYFWRTYVDGRIVPSRADNDGLFKAISARRYSWAGARLVGYK